MNRTKCLFGFNANTPDIPGLTLISGLLDQAEQIELVVAIDQLPWQMDLKRRVQHYGYRYDYKARRITSRMGAEPIPEFLKRVGELLVKAEAFVLLPDQVIVNEYLPGQGIAAHIDCEPCFGDIIVTVSLGSKYEMDFINVETAEVKSMMLPVGSALVLTNAARYGWKHRIRARKKDHGILRQRRISLTFRNVILAK